MSRDGMSVKELLTQFQALKTHRDAMLFIINNSYDNPYLWENIKYVSVYLGTEERTRILKLFAPESV